MDGSSDMLYPLWLLGWSLGYFMALRDQQVVV
jgi:hypothetical protein